MKLSLGADVSADFLVWEVFKKILQRSKQKCEQTLSEAARLIAIYCGCIFKTNYKNDTLEVSLRSISSTFMRDFFACKIWRLLWQMAHGVWQIAHRFGNFSGIFGHKFGEFSCTLWGRILVKLNGKFFAKRCVPAPFFLLKLTPSVLCDLGMTRHHLKDLIAIIRWPYIQI